MLSHCGAWLIVRVLNVAGFTKTENIDYYNCDVLFCFYIK